MTITPTVESYWVANGVILNTHAYGIETLGGREGIPPRRGENTPAGRRNGRRKTKKAFDQRVLTLGMYVLGRLEDGSGPQDPIGRFRTNLELLKEVFSADDIYLERYRHTDVDGTIHLWTWAECTSTLPLEIQDKGGGGAGKIVVELTMPDPFWYGDEQRLTIDAPRAASGLTFPVVFPAVFGEGGSPGSQNVQNTGQVPSERLKFRINGPVTTPRISHVQSNTELILDIALAPGEFLDLDVLSKSIVLNGTAARGGALVPGSQWPTLVVGDNEIQFRVALGTGNLEVVWSSAYL